MTVSLAAAASFPKPNTRLTSPREFLIRGELVVD